MQLALSKLILSFAVSIATNWVALSSFEIFEQKSLFFFQIQKILSWRAITVLSLKVTKEVVKNFKGARSVAFTPKLVPSNTNKSLILIEFLVVNGRGRLY